MSRHELELAYFRAVEDWIHQQHNTLMVVRAQDLAMYPAQQAKEKAAYKRFQEARLAFLNAPME